MKPETMIAKMNAILGITEVAEEIQQKKIEKEKGLLGNIPEEEVQEFRTLQGILYYLQAPQLFSTQVCRWHECGQPFMVSRRLIVYCSWNCMRHAIQWEGFEWRKGEGIEYDEKKMLTFIQDKGFLDGQEPIWIRDLPKLKEALEKLVNFSEEYQSKSTDSSPSEQLTS